MDRFGIYFRDRLGIKLVTGGGVVKQGEKSRLTPHFRLSKWTDSSVVY